MTEASAGVISSDGFDNTIVAYHDLLKAR